MFDRISHHSAHGRTPPRAVAVLLVLALPVLAAWAVPRPVDAQRRTTTSPVPVDPARARAMRAAFDSAVVDTQVSKEGQKVLQTIPDPLAKSAQVPPPVIRIEADSTAALALPDSIESPVDSTESVEGDSASVPAPEEVQVLGDFTLPVAIPDSLLAPAQNSIPTGGFGAVGTPVASDTPAAQDSCWGIQIAAPTEADRAETLRSAAQSLLLVPMKVEASGGRHRVQTRDCVSGEVAEKLRARALDSGFDGTFRTLGGAALPPPVSKTSKPATTGKKPKKR
jgi:hypothetical protein